jgi:nitrate/nitrite transporter NarK
MTILRSTAGAVGGYLLFALTAVVLFQVSGQRPHAQASLPFMAGTAAYGMIFAAVGGWFAARVAGRRPALHGFLVALLIAVGAAFSLLFSGAGARWSQWEALLLMAPMAVVGALLSKSGTNAGGV